MIDFDVVVGDITKYSADVIVNAFDRAQQSGGDLNQAIQSVAGSLLERNCKTLKELPLGKAKFTLAYNLPATYLIHVSIPTYDKYRKTKSFYYLKFVYSSICDYLISLNHRSVLVPAIGCDEGNFPIREAVHIAIRTFYDYRNSVSGCPDEECKLGEWKEIFDGGNQNPLESKITFVAKDENIAQIYREEIQAIKDEEKNWNIVQKLILGYSNEELDDDSFDCEEDNSYECTSDEIETIDKIFSKYPHFWKRDQYEILFSIVHKETEDALPLMKILFKYGAEFGVVQNFGDSLLIGSVFTLNTVKNPKVKKYLSDLVKENPEYYDQSTWNERYYLPGDDLE